VTMLIDMTRRALAFSINGQAPIDAGIELPPAVRPWVLTVGRPRGDEFR